MAQRRSSTNNHILLPASGSSLAAFEPIPHVPAYSLVAWTLGRGSVVWRIWPAVLLHTLFASAITMISMRGIMHLEIPNVMLTVLGVVIGFVISYRAMSGYERYWLGRTYWSDVIRNARTLGRLIWFHVPPRLTPKTPEETQSGECKRSIQEMNKVMAEKRMALDLIDGYAVSLKHHIRGELGIYYEDLYHLIRPLHEHDHTDNQNIQHAMTSALPVPRKAQRITTKTHMHSQPPPRRARSVSPDLSLEPSDPAILTINAYGTFDPNKLTSSSPPQPSHLPPLRRSASHSSHLSSQSQHQPLLPSTQPPADTVMDKISSDLIPLPGLAALFQWFHPQHTLELLPSPDAEVDPGATSQPQRRWQGPVQSSLYNKHRPRVAGSGENLPLEILRCLSEWLSVLEDRGTVPGSSMGPMINAVAAMEDSLSGLERILTTPLPFSYQVTSGITSPTSAILIQISFVEQALVSLFGYYTIPGVAIAAFIYLGFLAAGEEIEQPFGYDDNDLDLDLFCHAIVHADIKQLKTSPCLNAYLGPPSDTRLQPTCSLSLRHVTEAEQDKKPIVAVAAS
ncbi:uncharacterized protein LACBIDRAFT_312458 [Laccaria bicolor S238N-H82]|uniref:Predicted protein n=1 Tax=Laccaria bicolor (strain S238N-H82 / ATCC MYA-4686) TaxID=486041 RepID=B0DW79_LACBS|nr:uncharacterized protein LACBIDRAFT_312458 [Laccaria bicolor S238N-H82]EDR01137.1 predicted protein [Laccaria bicolor S238N-H82]|eukprot:XP_001888179.1 predicted protein [Laccaria bicolor S238N-H82]